MQSSSSSYGVPTVLARYPVEIQSAYVRFTSEQDEAALRLLVQAALREYMPRLPGSDAEVDVPTDVYGNPAPTQTPDPDQL